MEKIIPFVCAVFAVIFFVLAPRVGNIPDSWGTEMAATVNILGVSSLLLAGGFWFSNKNTGRKCREKGDTRKKEKFTVVRLYPAMSAEDWLDKKCKISFCFLRDLNVSTNFSRAEHPGVLVFPSKIEEINIKEMITGSGLENITGCTVEYVEGYEKLPFPILPPGTKYRA